MSDLKFFCPNCGQHVVCDDGWAGARIQCPTCQAEVTVPSAPTVPPPGVGLSRPAVPPLAQPPRPRGAPLGAPGAKEKTCGLAIASLVCSLLSLVFCVLGSIAGIICGHLAKAEMRREPSLKGQGLATWGLIVGYLSAGLTVALVVAAVCYGLSFPRLARFETGRSSYNQTPPIRRRGREAPPPIPAPRRPVAPRPPPGASQPETGRNAAELSRVRIPDAVASGRIHGVAFTCESAELRGITLVLRQGREFFPVLAVEIVLFTSPAGLEGRTFTVTKDTGPGQPMPHILLKWKQAGGNVPESKFCTRGYTLQLEFGRKANGRIPGKIYLALPDQEQTFVAGTFEARTQ